MDDIPWVIPVLKNSGHIGEVHVIGTLIFQYIRSPVCFGEWFGDIADAFVGPAGSTIVGLCNSNAGSVYPGYPGQMVCISASVGIYHIPFLIFLIPDHHRIGCSVKDGVSEKGFIGYLVFLFCFLLTAEAE